MTTEQIEILFHETINNKEAYGKALYNQLDGVTENQLYNWRKQRTKPTIGDMLNVLYQLKKIEIHKAEAQTIDAELAYQETTIVDDNSSWVHNFTYNPNP